MIRYRQERFSRARQYSLVISTLRKKFYFTKKVFKSVIPAQAGIQDVSSHTGSPITTFGDDEKLVIVNP